MKRIDVNAIISGIIVLVVLSLFLHLYESHLFWIRAQELRTLIGLKSTFEAGELVIYDLNFLFYVFLFLTVKYAIAAYVVGRSVECRALLNSMVFGIIGVMALTVFQYLGSSKAILDYSILSISEMLWALLVCYTVGSLIKFKQRRSNKAFNR
jgi:hypothetical protein